MEANVVWRWTPSAIIALAIVAALTAGSTSPAQPKAVNAAPADETGYVALKTVCGGCHTLVLVTDRKRVAADWRRIYDKMARLGLPGTDDQIIAAGRYIQNHLTMPAEAAAPAPSGGR